MNMGCRIIWGHEMLKRAARHNLISPYQFGGQNGHMSISCVLLKRTSYDIIRLMCLVAVIFDNDATAAYDHMIPSQMYDYLTSCWGSRVRYPNEINSPMPNEILRQNSLWQLFDLLHEHLSSHDPRTSSRKLRCRTHLDLELICPIPNAR
jgi:hypothetical protein